jgi:hypothetical protein
MPKPPTDEPFTTDQLAQICKMTAVISEKPLDQLASVALYAINCMASAELANISAELADIRELEDIARNRAKAGKA